MFVLQIRQQMFDPLVSVQMLTDWLLLKNFLFDTLFAVRNIYNIVLFC